MLADEIIKFTEGSLVSRDLNERLGRAVRNAHRFVFDDRASRRLGEIIRDAPDLLARGLDWAVPPFEQTWIEIDFKAFFSELARKGGAVDSDDRTGFLIDNDHVYVTGSTLKGGTCGWMPICYRLGEVMKIEDELKVASQIGTSRVDLDQILWGSTWNRLDDSDRRSLRGRHAIKLLPTSKEMAVKDWQVVIESCIGDLRTVLTAMLLLVRPAGGVQLMSVDRAKGFSRGKMQTYMDHSMVLIDLDASQARNVILGGEATGDERRRHQVRGHWCQSRRLGRGCSHAWRETDERQFKCQSCGAKRWWRREMTRGSAAKGWVHSAHAVTVR